MTRSAADRFAAAIAELRALRVRLEHATAPGRPLVYAECLPLLEEISDLNKPPLPGREVNSLIHETGWHLRSLAGLARVKGGKPEEHSAWAEQSLLALAAWGECIPTFEEAG